MFLFGMMESGLRGFSNSMHEEDEVAPEDLDAYGIDWDDHDEPTILAHHDAHNLRDVPANNPFAAHFPNHLAHVEVEEFQSPLTVEQIALLDAQIQQLPCYHSASLGERRLLWVHSLQICQYL
jgi:hypothetical protein